MLSLIKEIRARRELLQILVGRNLKIRYKNSSLGFFWSLLSPLFLIVIYAVFLNLIRIPIDLPVLVSGIIVWQFLAMCLGDSLYAIVGNANLVTKAAFPRIILPLAMVGSNLVNFLLSCIVLFVYLIVAGADFGVVLALPFLVVTQAALCLGVALIFSTANVFFRDTEHILSIVMLAWFFLTPIIYDPDRVLTSPGFPGWVHVLFFANPMSGIVTAYRMILLSAQNPGTAHLCLSFAVAWAILCIGLMVFQKAQPRFGDEL
jgi:ABC-type polysaccharide/polyol phosphate export permease